MKTVLLKNIEAEYLKEIKIKLDNGENICVDTLIELSINLHKNIKAKGIPTEIQDYDMLLFQYGTYDYPNLGKHFSFDITRQFSKKNPDAPIHQLSFTLVFDPSNFESLENENFWSMDFENLEEFAKAIRKTEVYKIAKEIPFREYNLTFDQC